MDDGVVVAEGTPDEIMREDVLQKVFKTPVHVVDGPGGRFAMYHRVQARE